MTTIHVPDGMELIECTAEPRHPVVVLPYDEDVWYPAPCPWCLHEEAWEHIRELEDAKEAREHRRHCWYSRSRLAHWLAGWTYQLGIIASHGTVWSKHCHGCLVDIRFRGRRPYLLGLERWKWTCLRRGHLPGDYIGLDCCAKCAPCPDCGSTTSGHHANCVSA